jgi:hypothetical protein
METSKTHAVLALEGAIEEVLTEGANRNRTYTIVQKK